jgi:hypothetical protein
MGNENNAKEHNDKDDLERIRMIQHRGEKSVQRRHISFALVLACRAPNVSLWGTTRECINERGGTVEKTKSS